MVLRGAVAQIPRQQLDRETVRPVGGQGQTAQELCQRVAHSK